MTQSTLDALADAETLRLALKITKSGNPQCVVEGLWATARMRDGDTCGAYVAAREAARDAFLRVPALRDRAECGEKERLNLHD